MEEKPLPEVSQERFFEVKGNLKSAFMGGSNLGSDKPFSFFGGDDEETADTKKSDEDQSSGFLLSRTFGLNSSKLPYDSSDSEDEDLTQTDVKHDEKRTSKVKETVNPADLTVVQRFFFSLNDPRLKDIDNILQLEVGYSASTFLKTRLGGGVERWGTQNAGPLQFYRSDSKEALTARWEGLRSELESRKRHRKAVRDGRHRHIKRKKH